MSKVFYMEQDFTNPYYEKWTRGRPTKQKVEKRKLSIQWETVRIIYKSRILETATQ